MASLDSAIPVEGGRSVKNNFPHETVLHREVVLDIIRSNGWPDAISSDQNELFSRKGWLTRFTVTLDPTISSPIKTTERSPTKTSSAPQAAPKKQLIESCFSSLLKETEHQLHNPRSVRRPIPVSIPKHVPKISIKVSHLQNLKASLKYMDDWLKTFANRNAFSSCTLPMGSHSLSNSQGFYWVHNRCFIQMENEKSDAKSTNRTQDLSRLQKIAIEIDSFLRNQRSQRPQCSSKVPGQTAIDPSTSSHTHTYPIICTITYSTNPSHKLIINLPAILRLILPSYDRDQSVCQYKLAHLEHNILAPDDNISVSGASTDGLFGFKCNKDKSGKEVINFLVGNRERFVVWTVKIRVDVAAMKEVSEQEKIRREEEEKEWEYSLAEGGCVMIQG